MMPNQKYDPKIHHRHSIRLKEFDYSQPWSYFITICTYQRECILGEIVDGKMILNGYGKTVQFTWHDLPNHIAAIHLNQYVIMPNHFHGIITIHDQAPDSANLGEGSENGDRQGYLSKPTPKATYQTTLPEIVHNLKSKSTRRINLQRRSQGTPVWQKNYYEHIIRNEISYNKIVEYIQNNPVQ